MTTTAASHTDRRAALADAGHRWREAKEAIRQWQAVLAQAEQDILQHAGSLPTEGAKKVPAGPYVIKATNRLNWSFRDDDAAAAVRAVITREAGDTVAESVVSTKTTPKPGGLRKLREMNPGLYDQIIQFLVSKPAKTSIDVDRMDP